MTDSVPAPKKSFFSRFVSPVTTTLAITGFILGGCANLQLGLRPLPQIYKNADSPTDKAFVTIGAFASAQQAYIKTCEPVADRLEKFGGDITKMSADDTANIDTCIVLGTGLDTLEPAVSASGLAWAAYSDVDTRIRQAGPKAPREWLALAAELYAIANETYGPVKADVDAFIQKTKELN